MAASAEAAFAPEPVSAENLEGVVVALQLGLKRVTGNITGKSDKGHTELPTYMPPREVATRAAAFFHIKSGVLSCSS
jgi:hypothetical protein